MDAELMERVFYNLLLNAVQATPAERRGDDQDAGGRTGWRRSAVIDRGSGIDPKMMKTIFNPFVTTKPDGVGLGLAIVSKIVDEHGGRMSVESEPGKGSMFRVRLPADALSRDCMKKRILVVEDEEKLRRVIELQLASAGLRCGQGGDGRGRR